MNKELNDIRRVMGLPLLLEGGIMGITTEFLSPIFRKLLNKGDDYVFDLTDTITLTYFDNIMDELGLPKSTLYDIIDTFNDESVFASLDVVRKRNVFKVISEIDELAKPLGEELLKSLSKLDSISSLDDINKSILTKKLKNSISYEEALEQLFDGTNFAGLEPLFEKLYKGSFFIYERKVKNWAKVAKLGKWFFSLLPRHRNLNAIVSILTQTKKGVETLQNEVESLFKKRINNIVDLKDLKKQIENKLATIERLQDNAAKTVLKSIDDNMKVLKKSGEITNSQYDMWVNDMKKIKDGDFWEKFIAPNYEELDNASSGLGSFFKNGWKAAFKSVSIDTTRRRGVFGWVPKVAIQKEGFTRLFNFLLLNSAQTSSDVLKRLIKSDASWSGNLKVLAETYVRLIGPNILIPVFNAVVWTLWIPTTEVLDDLAASLGVDVDWDRFETSLIELIVDNFIFDLFDLLDKDPDKDMTQIELDDLKPVVKSLLLQALSNWAVNNDEDDIEEPNEDDFVDADEFEIVEPDSGEPGSLSHAIEELGDGVTQEGEFFIYRGDKYKWNGTYYGWVPE